MNRKNIVLLGIGHTNAHVVKEWASNPIPGCHLICISKFPTATYSGMLPGTLGGQFVDDEMRIDLRQLCDQAGATLILAETNGLDLSSGQVHFRDHDSIPFDALSVGVGSMPAGWQQHSDSPLLVPIKPMQTFLERLDKNWVGHRSAVGVERAGRGPSGHTFRVAIVGGGVASVEIAFCLQERYRRNHATCELEIDIFTSRQRVADGMTRRSVRQIEDQLADRRIEVHAGCYVTEVGDTFLKTEDGRRHQRDCVIWATGAAAPPVIGTLGLQTDELGFVATSSTLQSLTDPRVFAVGDSGTVIESPSPKAGVYAVRQCPILRHNLRAFIEGGDLQTFQPQGNFLKILNTGDGKALLEYGWITVHARWCWKLKTWIDRRFVREFQTNRPGSRTETSSK